jgi:cobalt-zinc-cadmium efflux system outer membrane protein
VRRLVLIALLGFLPAAARAQDAPPYPVQSVAAEGNVVRIARAVELPSGDSSRPIVPEPLAGSGEQAGTTLAELEEMAARGNPTLAQAAARVQAARGQYVQTGLYPNPVIAYQGTEIGDDGRAGQQGGFLGQEIVTAGKLRLNQSVANEEIRQAECVLEAQRMRVLTDVRRGFYDVLLAQSSLDVAEQLLRIGEQGVRTAEELMRAKEVARTDLLQARIEADSARILLEKARNRGTSAWRSLAAVVGNPQMQPTRLRGDLRADLLPYTWEDALNRLWTESPQLAAAQTGIARAQAVLSRECAERTPNVALQLGVQYDNATHDTIAGVQVGVPLPIYNRNQGNIRKAEAELTAAHQEVARLRLSLQQQLAAVFEQYATARQQVESYSSNILPNATESLKLVSAGYRQGEFGYVMLLTAQRTYFQTHLAYLDALRDLRTAAAAIEGNLLSDSLQVGEPAERSLRQK